MMLDALADKLGADVSEKKHKALCGKAVIGGQKVILLKPQTYMNSRWAMMLLIPLWPPALP